MSTLAFPAPAPVTLPIAGRTERFPVRRVFCVGRNYAAHAREMGAEPDLASFFFFTKFADAVCETGTELPYPPGTSNYQYEGELVLAIGMGGRNIPEGRAMEHVFGFACGLDMTRRDVQLAARDKGRPWDAGKNFEMSAPTGTIRPASTDDDVASWRLELQVNREPKQRAELALMLFPPARIIEELSRLYRLESGDLVFTGTPEGVGPVRPGDSLRVTIGPLPPLEVRIGPASTSDR